MKTSDAFPSKYLKAEDFEGDVALTISYVEMETLKNKDGKDEQKPICYFNETDKGLVLNKTNWDAIVKLHGDESDEWGGKSVTLTVIDVTAFGETKPAIRVKQPRKVSGTPVKSSANGNGNKADPITAFWTFVNSNGIDAVEAAAIVKKHNNDFGKALAELQPQA